jgi:DNA polymerase elongation subunit (family B)
MKFIADCSILLDIYVELSGIYKKFLVTKKKHYIEIPLDEMKDPVIKGMEGVKSDRLLWINKIERQVAEDIKNDKNPFCRAFAILYPEDTVDAIYAPDWSINPSSGLNERINMSPIVCPIRPR